MIGGTDVVFPAAGDPADLEACLHVVHRYWPRARFEDAVTGDKYGSLWEIPLGRVREVLVYPDANAEAAWDADNPDSPPNSMLYLIVSQDSITAVVDDPDAAGMRSILDSMREMLWAAVWNTVPEAA